MFNKFAPIILLLCTAVQAEIHIVYPGPESANDKRDTYPIQILQAVFKSIGEQAKIEPTRTPMQQGRALLMLEQKQVVNLVWSMTSKDREKKLLPVRIPLFKGLIGHRIFLVHDDFKESLANLTSNPTLEALQRFTFIQGHDWPDTAILKGNGFTVLKHPRYDGLFTILQKKRAHFFPRSVAEIWAEYDKYKDQQITIEPHVMLKYPAAVYYFVHPSDIEIAKTIEKGLHKIIDNGEFDKIFKAHYQKVLDKAQLGKRLVFTIENQLLPKETPVDDTKLWLQY